MIAAHLGVVDEEQINNMSIVCRVTYGEMAFLFGGDAEREEEQDLENARLELSADVQDAEQRALFRAALSLGLAIARF